jgi:hypothetical protein
MEYCDSSAAASGLLTASMSAFVPLSVQTASAHNSRPLLPPHLPKTGTQLGRKEIGLLESREVAAAVEPVPIDQVHQALFGPAPGHAEDLLGKDAKATGMRTGSGIILPKLSQYRRAEEAADPRSQYIMTQSSISSRVSTFSGFPLQSVQAQNFSKIQAACSCFSTYPSAITSS